MRSASGSVAMLQFGGNAGSFFDDVVVTGLTSGPAARYPRFPGAIGAISPRRPGREEVKTGNQVDFSWTMPHKPTGFRIERKTAAERTRDRGGRRRADGVLDAGLTAGTTYTYRVRTTNAVGNSDYSNEAVVTRPSIG